MKLEEQIIKLSGQRKELKKELEERETSLTTDRRAYEIDLILSSTTGLAEEEYSLLEFKIGFAEKTKDMDYQEKRQYIETLPEQEQEQVKKELPASKLIGEIKKLSKEKRLLAAEYLVSERYIKGGCGSDVGWFKTPSGCGACVDAKKTIDELELWDFLQFKGDRQYGLEEEKIQEAFAQAMSEDDESKKQETHVLRKKQETLEKLDMTLGRLREKLFAHHLLESKGYDSETIAKQVPEMIQYLVRAGKRSKSKITDVKVDLESKTLAVLLDYWYYSGTGGCEYGKTLEVHRGDTSASKGFVYRDAYSASKDDWSLAFDKIESLAVKEDNIQIKLKTKSVGKEQDVSFKMKYEKQGVDLSEDKKEAFLKTYQAKKEELLKIHTREHGMMKAYIPFYSTPTMGGKEIPYQRAETIDEFVDDLKGEATLVIKSQIDHHAGRGMQFEWVKYKISTQGTELIDRDCAYESELKRGKEIKMKA